MRGTIRLEPRFMSSASFTVGQLADRFGLNPSAIRYYERTGVLPPPDRESGRRRYGPDAVRRLEVLEAAKHAGFTLDEAKLLLQRTEAGTPAFDALRDLAERSPQVDALIACARTCATDCSCTSLGVCGLFEPAPRAAPPLNISHVGATR